MGIKYGIDFGFEQSRQAELVINKNGVPVELQTVDRKDHFTDALYPETNAHWEKYIKRVNQTLASDGIFSIEKR
jgi:hypothetical protein